MGAEALVDVLVAEFRSWLAVDRGLSRETVRCYGTQAGKFLAGLAEPLDAAARQLDSGQITAFMVDYCRDYDPASAKAMATALRALLRFLHVSGRNPGTAGGRGSGGGGLAAGIAATRA